MKTRTLRFLVALGLSFGLSPRAAMAQAPKAPEARYDSLASLAQAMKSRMSELIGKPVEVVIDEQGCKAGGLDANSLYENVFKEFLSNAQGVPWEFATQGAPPGLAEIVQYDIGRTVLQQRFKGVHLTCTQEARTSAQWRDGVLYTSFNGKNPMSANNARFVLRPDLKDLGYNAGHEQLPLAMLLTIEHMEKETLPKLQQKLLELCGAKISVEVDWEGFKTSGPWDNPLQDRPAALYQQLGGLEEGPGNPKGLLGALSRGFQKVCQNGQDKKAIQGGIQKIHIDMSPQRTAKPSRELKEGVLYAHGAPTAGYSQDWKEALEGSIKGLQKH